MHILHYTLGLPPERSGGLTKYATDLMVEQAKGDNAVSLLYPGYYTFWRKPTTRIRKKGIFNHVSTFEIVNPVPVPLLHGIKSPESIYNPKYRLNAKQLTKFFITVTPDVFHIHTFMGLPLELLRFLKERKVKIVYTTHDYFGLCAKVNFIDYNKELCNAPNAEKCAKCNYNAPSELFIKLRNSGYILRHKNLIKKGSPHPSLSKPVEIKTNEDAVKSFEKLINWYKDLFTYIDAFHFNSQITKEVFSKFLQVRYHSVISITHSNIKSQRTLKIYTNRLIRIGFIGSLEPYKGFYLLKKALISLMHKGINNWKLQAWGSSETGCDSDCANIVYKGRFNPEQLKQVLANIDFLVVPSIWFETFGFVTLEAISNGVPVLVSQNVGSKDIVKSIAAEFIVEPTVAGLERKIGNILSNPDILADYNRKIMEMPFSFDLKSHAEEIANFYHIDN